MPPSQLHLPPGQRFVWESLSVDDRCKRAEYRAHIKTEFEQMEPTMTKEAFDFYNTYVRISEGQKYKFAEARLILYYKDLLDEVMK